MFFYSLSQQDRLIPTLIAIVGFVGISFLIPFEHSDLLLFSENNPLYQTIASIEQRSYLRISILSALFALNCIMANFIFDRSKLERTKVGMIPFFMLPYMMLLGVWSQSIVLLFISLLALWVLSNLVSILQEQQKAIPVFNSGFIIAIGGLVWPPFLAMGGVVLICLLVLSEISFRRLFLLLIGIAAPIYLFFGINYLSNYAIDSIYLLDWFEQEQSLWKDDWSLAALLLGGLAFALISMVQSVGSFRFINNKSRKTLSLYYAWMVGCGLLSILLFRWSLGLIFFATPIMAYFAALNTNLRKRKNLLNDLLFTIWILAIIYVRSY